MRSIVFTILLVLLFAGNSFALYKLVTDKESFLSKFPKLTEAGFRFMLIIPFANLVSIVGIWFWQSWAAYLAILCCIAVIICDIYFGIHYHLFVAIPSSILLLYFIFKYWNNFK